MNILGISAFFHDSAAAILCNGKIIAAAQEERFSRIKNDQTFPKEACYYCLNQANLSINEIDAVVFYEKPFVKFERILETYYQNSPKGLVSFLTSMPEWLTYKLFLRRKLSYELKKLNPANQRFDEKKIYFSEHHLSHGASTYFTSKFNDSAVLIIDGVGESATTSIFHAMGNKLVALEEIHFPHSLGLLYSSFTYFLGFSVNSGEYKLMGLAPYGNPHSPSTKEYISSIKSEIVTINADGSFVLNMKYFKYPFALKMIYDNKWEKLFKMKRRMPESELLQCYCDLAYAIQNVTEEIILKLAQHTKDITKSENLCIAGGVGLNCVANGKLLNSRIFKNIHIQPASGDAGGALGAALGFYYIQNHQWIPSEDDFNPYLGPEYLNDQVIKLALKYHQIEFSEHPNFLDLYTIVTDRIMNGEIVGWFQGRMEFGPRALGNRSILGDAKNPLMQKKINQNIKYRESFRPFAPSVILEDIEKIFQEEIYSPYMLLTVEIKDSEKIKMPDNYIEFSPIEKLNTIRSSFPSVTHVDFSSRVHTVTKDQNPIFYGLLKRMQEKTGYGILLNTSLNIRGEPIVCGPEDAIECFLKTEMDLLVINNILFVKK